MQLMNDEAVVLWAAHRGIEKRGRKLVFDAHCGDWIAIEIPEIAIKRLILSGDLFLAGNPDEAISDLIWISTWGIWDAWRDHVGEFIVSHLRAKGGKIVPLDGQSGHLFDPTERTLSTAVLWQTMLFNWDVFVVPGTGDYIVECSHDQIVWIMCKTQAMHHVMLERLARWKPKVRRFVST